MTAIGGKCLQKMRHFVQETDNYDVIHEHHIGF